MSIKNEDFLPVEKLTIVVNNDGVIKNVNALDPYWAKDCSLILYERPPLSNISKPDALDNWNQMMQEYLEQLKWLLSLEHHVFWSTIVYHSQCMDMLISFLQEANPPYMQPYCESVQATYEDIRKHVLVVFSRLITNKESKEHYMHKDYMRDVIYNKFIFTIPILWDICLIYGADNRKHVGRILTSVFTLQPKYLKDLEAAISFVKEAFKYITIQVNKYYDSVDPPNLPKTFTGFFDIKRPQSAPVDQTGLTYDTLKDLIVHLLDTVLTLRLFIEMYPKSVGIFKSLGFFLSITQLYEYAIPQLYEKVDEIGGNKDSCARMNGYIDSIRMELIDTFRETLASHKYSIFSTEVDIEHHVEEYLALMMDGLSESLFIKDYDASYPVTEDIEMLKLACPNIDTVKTDFILQAIYSSFDEPIKEKPKLDVEEINGNVCDDDVEAGPSRESEIPTNVKEESCISEVKDIFPQLGDGYILKCLQHYNFNAEEVINRLLEDSLADELRTINKEMPIIPEDVLDKRYMETGIERYNVFDGDQFDIMSRNDVDVSKIHIGKRKSVYKNLNEMLDDKSAIKSRSDIYSKYNLVCDEVDMYSDEYDDSYADEAGSFDVVPSADTGDDLGRPFVTPRALMKPTPKEIQAESSSSEEEDEAQNKNRLDFCVNPEEMRARREANRIKNSKGPKVTVHKSADVTGKPKGQGQEKDVLKNRDNKEKHKSFRANHNRRQGAQWKRTRGMVPS